MADRSARTIFSDLFEQELRKVEGRMAAEKIVDEVRSRNCELEAAKDMH